MALFKLLTTLSALFNALFAVRQLCLCRHRRSVGLWPVGFLGGSGLSGPGPGCQLELLSHQHQSLPGDRGHAISGINPVKP